MFDCCSIIGSATTLRAKMRGSSATTLTVSSKRVICMTMGDRLGDASRDDDCEISTVSKPGRTAVTR